MEINVYESQSLLLVFVIRTKAATEVALRFYSFHIRFVSRNIHAIVTEIPLGSAAIGSQWVQPFRHGDPIELWMWLRFPYVSRERTWHAPRLPRTRVPLLELLEVHLANIIS
eukprot:COSAG01_NODE_4403_length_5060_cov_15.005644_7_plen_112_part_00